MSLSDINIVYLILMQKEGTVVNGRSPACHGINLVLNLNQKVLKFLVFFSDSFSMNFPCSWKVWFQLLKCWHASIALRFNIVVVQSFVKRGVRLSDILYFAEQTF